MSFKSFYVQTLILFVLLTIAIFVINTFASSGILSDYVWYINIFFLVLTWLTHWLSKKGVDGDPLDFSNYFLSASAIRLLLSAAILVGYFYLVNFENVTFLVNFFIIYLLYTGFEIITLLTNLRPNSKK